MRLAIDRRPAGVAVETRAVKRRSPMIDTHGTR